MSVVRGPIREIYEKRPGLGLGRTVDESREDEQDGAREEMDMPENSPLLTKLPPRPATSYYGIVNNGATVPVPLHWDPLMRRTPRPYALSSGQEHQSPSNDRVPEPKVVEMLEPEAELERHPILLEMAPTPPQKERLELEPEPEPQSTSKVSSTIPLQHKGTEQLISPSTFVSSLHVSDSLWAGATSSEQRSPLRGGDAHRQTGTGGMVGSQRDSGAETMMRRRESDIVSSLNWDG
jgi:hypothetical protein